MRRLIATTVLGLSCGCYLFGDEPKARKQADGGSNTDPDGPTDPGADGPAATTSAEPAALTPEGEIADCPELLTGVETQARTLASGCGPVRVRGTYRIDGGSLTIEAGVELRFEPGAALEVGREQPGVLTVRGTAEQPVRMVADSVSDSGGWLGLRLHAGATGSSLTQLEVAGAGSADAAALWLAAAEVRVDGLKLRGPGLGLELVEGAQVELIGAELAGVGVVARANPTSLAGLHDLDLVADAFVAITPGTITGVIEWPPNRYRVEGIVRVEGTAEHPAQLSLAAGTDLRFTPEARIEVGGLGPGTLSASASAGGQGLPLPAPDGYVPPPPAEPPVPPAPPGLQGPDMGIHLRAADDARPGSWSGLRVQDQGRLTLRNVELSQGGGRDEGVIVAEGDAELSLEGCVFRANLVGVELRGVEVEIETLDLNQFEATPVAVRTSPALLGALGPSNHYDELARIDVERGKVEASATWAAQAAPILIHGDVFVDRGANLVVAPGVVLGFDPGVILGVGYYERATLDMRGTADAPIRLVPGAALTSAPGSGSPPASWGGVVLGAQASKTRFEHVELRGTSNAAGIELRDTADATLVNVDCAGCAGATVKWDCGSSVGNIGVSASEGTPTPLLAPSACQ